jgi:hypothetical protein
MDVHFADGESIHFGTAGTRTNLGIEGDRLVQG